MKVEGRYRNKTPFWIILAIFLMKIIKSLYIVSCIGADYPTLRKGIAIMAGDAISYIMPMENYITQGKYEWNGVKVGRVPYLGVLYYPFRKLFSQDVALSIIVFIQIVLDSISIYYLALLAERIAGSPVALFSVIALSVSNMVYDTYNVIIITESLTNSSICLFLYFYYQYSSQKSYLHLFTSGFFLSIATILRPFLAPLYVFIFLYELIYNATGSIQKKVVISIKNASIILLPLIVISIPWTIRNYLLTGEFIPFQEPYGGYPKIKNYGMNPVDLTVYKFISTIGEVYSSWTNDAGCYFRNTIPEVCKEYKLPDRIYVGDITPERIERFRAAYMEYVNTLDDSLGQYITYEAKAMANSYIKLRPFDYYVVSPFRFALRLILRPPTVSIPFGRYSTHCGKFYHLMIKATQILLYYTLLLTGIIGLIQLSKRNPYGWILWAFPIVIIFVFAIVVRYIEPRYFLHAHPSLMIGSAVFIARIYNGKLHRLFDKKIQGT